MQKQAKQEKRKKIKNREKKETKLEKEKMEGNLPTGNIDNIGEGKETSPPPSKIILPYVETFKQCI